MSRPSRAAFNAHPLVRRLSGEVIWLMLEEQGVPDAEIQAFMERWEKPMFTALHALDRLTAPGARGGIRILVPDAGAACARCAALDGLVVPAGHPSLAGLCPPFALDCPARAELLEPGHPDFARAMERALSPDDPGPASPHGDLLCGLGSGSDWPI